MACLQVIGDVQTERDI